MRNARPLAVAVAACVALLLVPAAFAGAQAAPSTAASTISSTPAAPNPIAGHISFVLEKAGGSPPFALLGERIVLRGIVAPYVSGQMVKVSVYRDGRKVAVQLMSVAPGPSASGAGVAGQFRINFASHYPGLVEVRAAHYATAQQGAFSARSAAVRYVHVNLGPGSSGGSVRLLQAELYVLHYAVSLTGVFDEGTANALIAYRKMTGLARVPYAGREVFELMGRHAGSFHVRYRGDGRHVEADLGRQVLAEIEPGGHVRTIYEMSSGKPSTPTVIGRFGVYEKTPGVNAKGMVDSNYFIGGYAIHGYPEVPTFAASHGCLRVPIPDASAIFSWLRIGTPVDVFY
ncbi:MAG: L,D-transpeptidase family protein [Actinomycetota bacterium]|nr:L,D-transpeptidase family protein [Actinomycetota bacterium]